MVPIVSSADLINIHECRAGVISRAIARARLNARLGSKTVISDGLRIARLNFVPSNVLPVSMKSIARAVNYFLHVGIY